MSALPYKFYRRDTTQVAKELLGKKLFHSNEGKITSGMIIETEAYLGLQDPACHTYQGRKTERVKSMYKNGGYTYVYFIYGMHFCLNVVTQDEKRPEAILIRALLPLDGIATMQKRRRMLNEKNLCSGPAKLCEALNIDRSCDGLSLVKSDIWIENYVPFNEVEKHITVRPRVGIPYAKEAIKWPLRFSVDPKDLKTKKKLK